MKDYSSTKSERENYILGYKRNHKNGTIDIMFADGSIYKNIDYCEKNVEIIEATQEKQAKKAVNNREKIVSEKNRAKGYSIIGSIVGAIGSTLVLVPMNTDLPKLITSVGIVGLCSAIPGLCKLKKENSKLKEVDKISYLNQNRERLEQFDNYQNSFVGIDKDVSLKLKKRKNPFSILHIDDFSQDDLETMIRNMDREDKFQFVYKKTK